MSLEIRETNDASVMGVRVGGQDETEPSGLNAGDIKVIKPVIEEKSSPCYAQASVSDAMLAFVIYTARARAHARPQPCTIFHARGVGDRAE